MQSKSKGLSLQPISQMPTQAVFRNMQSMAAANQGASVQLVINVKGQSFLLSSTSVGTPDLHWSFYSKESALWTFASADLEMVENMVVSAIDQVAGHDTITVIGGNAPQKASPFGQQPPSGVQASPQQAPPPPQPPAMPTMPAPHKPSKLWPQSVVEPQVDSQSMTLPPLPTPELPKTGPSVLAQMQQPAQPQGSLPQRPQPGGNGTSQQQAPPNFQQQPPPMPQNMPQPQPGPQYPQQPQMTPPNLPQQQAMPPNVPTQQQVPPHLQQQMPAQLQQQAPPQMQQQRMPPNIPQPGTLPPGMQQPSAPPLPQQTQPPPMPAPNNGVSQGQMAAPNMAPPSLPNTTQDYGAQQPKMPVAKTSGSVGVTLAGELSKVELANVIQSVAICRMTGKLEVTQMLEAVELYFDQGVLLHAALESTLNNESAQTGENVVLELMTWDDGEFRFDPGVATGERSITRRIDGLLMEGAALNDHRQMLRKLGLDMESRPVKWRPSLTEQEFEAVVQKGIPVNYELQKRIYCDVDGSLTVYDITKRLRLKKSDWVPIFVNLLTLELICMPNTGHGNKTDKLTAIEIDEKEAMQAWRSIMSPESAVLPMPLFMQMYLMEFDRAAKSTSTQFTVACIDFKYRNGDVYEAPANFAIREVMEQICHLKSIPDLIGEYFDGFVMLMPHEDSYYAKQLAEQISSRFANANREESLFDMRNVLLRMGAATAPFDSSDPGMLLKLAEMARDKAIAENKLVEMAAALDLDSL